MKTKKIGLASIIVDETIYPRHKISAGNVAILKEALRSGATFPPIILDMKTKKVIDGWHRIEAVRSVYGEEAKIEAEERDYSSKQDMVFDAIHLNAIQGYKLTTWDRVRSIVLLSELNADEERIQKALGITKEKLDKLMERIANGPTGEKIALKGSMKDFGGKKINAAQEEYNAGPGPGLSISVLLAQIIRALEADVIDLHNERIAGQFHRIIELYEEAAA